MDTPNVDNPLVSVIMTTYQRTEIARQTLESLKKNIDYPNLQWLIADDGSPIEHIEALLSVFGPTDTVIVTNAQRGGVGKSKNLALRRAFSYSPYVLLLEDDWLLVKPLPLGTYVRLLQNSAYGIVRMGYLGGEFSAKYQGDSTFSYWVLDQGSGVYVYSGQVSLRHERYYDVVGPHKEGLAPGEEELEMCIRYNGTENAPGIIWPGRFPCEFNTGFFVNIGTGNSLNRVKPESTTPG